MASKTDGGRAVRSTRGQRMSELVGDALEADQDFWGQKAWQELSDDEDISSEDFSDDEKKDKEDSDFDDVDEAAEEQARAEQAQEAEQQEKRRVQSERNKRKKGVYVDPALKTGAGSRPRKTARTGGAGRRGASVVMPATREMRATTKVSTISTNSAMQADRRKSRERAAATPAREPHVRLTQQQLLEEAARTEVENKRSLEVMLMLQEEKRREKARVDTGARPRVVYYSSTRGVRRDDSGRALDPIPKTISFTNTATVPSVINAKAPPKPEKPVCSVTGLPAKYRDPVSGIPYRTVEAFKVVRGGAKAVSTKRVKA